MGISITQPQSYDLVLWLYGIKTSAILEFKMGKKLTILLKKGRRLSINIYIPFSGILSRSWNKRIGLEWQMWWSLILMGPEPWKRGSLWWEWIPQIRSVVKGPQPLLMRSLKSLLCKYSVTGAVVLHISSNPFLKISQAKPYTELTHWMRMGRKPAFMLHTKIFSAHH